MTDPLKNMEWKDLSDDLHELSDWEQEFHARFGGDKFNVWTDPSRVREFIQSLLQEQKDKAVKKERERIVEIIKEESIYELCNDDCEGAMSFKSNLLSKLEKK